MKKKDNLSLYKVKSNSGRLISFINFCTSNNITIFNPIKEKEGFVFEIKEKDYLKLIKLDVSLYNIEILKVGGKKRFLGLALYRIGLVIGFILSMTLFFIFNNKLFQIHIYGLNNTSEEEVISELKDNGINIFSSLNFDKKNLENKLSEKFNFSLVSIITKGNSLILNVKESLPTLEDSYEPITADYNMVIEYIKVYSGSSNVKQGDILYKGDNIVFPYIEKNNNKVYVSPCADIVASIYYSDSYYFKNKEIKQVRTGKKKLISLNIAIGKWNILKSDWNNKFNTFEIVNKKNNISNYFIPINITKTYSYELENIEVDNDFNEEKDNIIKSLRTNINKKLPKEFDGWTEKLNITQVNDGVIVNLTYSCKIDLKYQ